MVSLVLCIMVSNDNSGCNKLNMFAICYKTEACQLLIYHWALKIHLEVLLMHKH